MQEGRLTPYALFVLIFFEWVYARLMIVVVVIRGDFTH